MYNKKQIKEIIHKLFKNPIKTLKKYYENHFLWIIWLSHSSTWEDVILDWMIQKDHWFYVDIGGFDPIYGNNTYLFYKKWRRGINVEPNRQGYNNFQKKRPKDINLQLAAWKENGELIFNVFGDGSMSTCDPETVERYKKTWQKVIDQYVVPIRTLEKIFDKYVNKKTIDIMSVDVEWRDMDVLESNNRDKYKPIYIVLETVEYGERGTNTWEKQNHIFDPYLAKKWYKVIAETWINTIYKIA